MSCIDLLFTNQPNLIIESGVHPTLHKKCHHQIIHARLSLKIDFPPPYERLMWDYKKADVAAINNVIENFDWDDIFQNKNINEQVKTFNEILLNIFSNFIPNKIVTINDKEPPWLTDEIKGKIKLKNIFYKAYVQNKSQETFEIIKQTNDVISDLIQSNKEKYYDSLSKKLIDPRTRAKAYWNVLKSFFSGKKIPLIPPLYFNNEFISNFKEKAEIFNDFFANQCTIISNSSILPNNPVSYTSDNLSSLEIVKEDVINLIKALDSNKAHGFDGISIRMLKLCNESISKPLTLLYKNCLNQGIFPDIWKKANVIPVHKKNDKSIMSNYRPISLLPICGKLFERLIYNTLFNFFSQRNLICCNQSGFRPGDSCVNQLISIVHMIHKSFDANPSLEVRGVFLDISKAFDKVWHDGLLYKLKSNGLRGNLFNLIEIFLTNRYQRVVLNGQNSKWKLVKAGVPQGSILRPLFFLIYINDLQVGLKSEVKMFADDTSLFSIVNDSQSSSVTLNKDLTLISKWAYQWKMNFNPDLNKQAQEVVFSRKTNKSNHPVIYFNNVPVSQSTSQKHLGIILDEKLSFGPHVQEKIKKANKGISIIRKLSNYLPRSSLITIYKSFIRPHLDYGDVIYDIPNNNSFREKIERIQYNACLAITGAFKGTSREKLYNELGLEYLNLRRWFRRLCLFFKIFKDQSPSYLYNIIPPQRNMYSLRNMDNIPLMGCRTETFSNSFFPYVISEWNKLDPDIRSLDSFPQFRMSILNIIRPTASSVFLIRDMKGLKLLSRLRLGLSHLNEHKFNHGFRDTINPLCNCSLEIESVSHFFLRCLNFTTIRTTLMNNIYAIDNSIINLNENSFINLLLYGDESSYNSEVNTQILTVTIEYIIDSQRFDDQIF